MGFFASMVAPRSNAAFREPFWSDIFTSVKSTSGKTVTVTTALQVMAVLGCVRVIAEGIAQVPLKVFQEREDGGRNVAKEHPLFRILHRKPNPWQTSFEFRETLAFHTSLAGRFIAFKNVVRGRIVELIPFEPECVTVRRNSDRSLTYCVSSTETGESKEFPAEAIWHIKGPSWNGWDGMEILRLARDAIGLSIATEEAHSLLHANGGQTSGMYSVESTLTEPQYRQLRDWIDRNISGLNKFKPFVLDRGAKWIPTSMTGVDAEHLATRKFQIEEVCRAFRVMPIMIGFSDKTATYASAEQMFLAHVVHTLMPWYERIEQSIDVNLLTDKDDAEGFYAKFLPNALMRGAAKDRGDFYYKLWQMGALNANQIRALEEMNPYEGGDVYRVPLNTEPTDEVEAGSQVSPPDRGPDQPGRRMNVGRVLSARNERRIRDADAALNEVLAELDTETEE
jgi:HK97 family phage portal protein